MTFENIDKAYDFYVLYAMLAGFNVKKNRKRYGKRGQDFECSFEGKHKKSPETDKVHDKTTMRKGCKAMVCAVQSKDGGPVRFKRIVLEHNHILIWSPRMVKRMREHNLKDPAFQEMIDMLLSNKVKHVKVMNIIKKAVGGCESLNMTEKDIQNRYFS